MPEFRNPYHFVPALSRQEMGQGPFARKDVPVSEIRTHPQLAHSLYSAGTQGDPHLSGTIRVRLRTVTPTVVGGEQSRQAGQAAVVEPAERNGHPIIPGSTLRGMISNIAEAASNSALRVLENRQLTYHKNSRHTENLSAIGMVIVRKTEKGTEYSLKPVTMPNLVRVAGNHFALPEEYHEYFPDPALRVYIGDRDSIRMENFLCRTSLGADDLWHAEVAPVQHWANVQQRSIEAPYNAKIVGDILIGQMLNLDDDSLLRIEYPPYTIPGWARVLGCWGDRQESMPPTKKREIFLPLPPPSFKAHPIPQHVVQRFHAVSDERTKTSLKARERGRTDPLLPFELKDRPRNSDPDDPMIRLQEGDLVYFRVDDETKEIAEISFSAIWRARIEHPDENGTPRATTVPDFFRAIDPNLAPFDSTRTHITPAEQMLGFATEDKRPDGIAAFASRVRVDDAVLDAGADANSGAHYLEAVTLKILGSPKPPSPALYFRPDAQGRRVRKDALSLTTGRPQGRKQYLHHRWNPPANPWESQIRDQRLLAQKMRVTPLRHRLEFVFDVHFDNLAVNELALLLYSVVPADTFHHKLGMGKSIGLGTVKLSIDQVGLVPRHVRYSVDGLQVDRSQAYTAWPNLRNRWSRMAHPDIHQALLLLGSIPADNIPIHTPTVEPLPGDTAGDEFKTFRWHVANDNGLRQQVGQQHRQIPMQERPLTPLNRESTSLPTLEEYEWEHP